MNVQLEAEIWLLLVGLIPELLSIWRINVTKQKGFDKFNVAAKWKRKYREHRTKVGLF